MIILLVISLIIPQLIKTIQIFINNIPQYQVQLQSLLQSLNISYDTIDLESLKETGVATIDSLKGNLFESIPNLIHSALGIANSVIGTIVNIGIAIGFAFTLLLDKERLKKQGKKLLYSFLKKEHTKKIIEVWHLSIDRFSKYVSAKCLDATIFGILNVIILSLLQIPYSIQIGVIMGVLYLIPTIGLYIGMVIGSILIVAISPLQVLIFIVVAFLLDTIQQNFIYPEVIKRKVELPDLWILVAIFIGGKLLGILGLLLCIPVASVIYTLLTNRINKIDLKEYEK